MSAKIKDQKGQLSIFLGIAILVIMTLLAFIINVGLFVKAKINLQNAVDSAAYAGAAVQARQLTNIGHLNWEMRNVYKEWMFKYYVLGQLGLKDLRSAPSEVSFRLKPFFSDLSKQPNGFDRYNLPSICILFGTESANICEIYDIPGLPRFDTIDTGIPGIVEHHREFLNSIVSTKAKDCSTRSSLNFGTAMIWAYGVETSIFENVPQVASRRVGAWIKSIEMGIRMRNLESIVNRPPVAEPICFQGSGCRPVSSLENETSTGYPLNERPIKAFMSAFRNLGGGLTKGQDAFTSSFQLTEIPPQPFEVASDTLSGFLLSEDQIIGQTGIRALSKHYLDLQAYPLNLVTFFTTFVSNTQTSTVADVAEEGACAGSKTALPVPGYILGFVKNPEVLTYYAVKGEANFVGLFFPFADRNGIQLKAYAAAKPFGGRIGPRLFDISQNLSVLPRDEGIDQQRRSVPYISGLETDGISYQPGLPIPIVNSFWIRQRDQPIGGVPTIAGSEPRFGVPNLLYDFDSIAEIDQQKGDASTGTLQILNRAGSKSQAISGTGEKVGLYQGVQYNKFFRHLGISNAGGQTLSFNDVDAAIERALMPTRYESLNYMIPHLEEDPLGSEFEENPVVIPQGGVNDNKTVYSLFAPLFGDDTIYGNNTDAIVTVVNEYLSANDNAINAFIDSLREVSEAVANPANDPTGKKADLADYTEAAATIFTASNDCAAAGGQPSMAAKFRIFFQGTTNGECGIVPLRNAVPEYFNRKAGESGSYQFFYTTSYQKNDEFDNNVLMTGYRPGPRQGSDLEGRLLNPIISSGGGDKVAKRNSYSTKHFALGKVLSNECNSGDAPSYCRTYFESADSSNPVDLNSVLNTAPVNLINSTEVSEFEPIRF